MAGIYSQGGSAGHRYAGWLSEVEAKNFQFGGKVFNGSPSAIYVGSNLVWFAPGLTGATQRAILGAFGQRDGKAVINATNAYLNQLAASGQAGKDKATALVGFINQHPLDAALYGGLYVQDGLVFQMDRAYECTAAKWTDFIGGVEFNGTNVQVDSDNVPTLNGSAYYMAGSAYTWNVNTHTIEVIYTPNAQSGHIMCNGNGSIGASFFGNGMIMSYNGDYKPMPPQSANGQLSVLSYNIDRMYRNGSAVSSVGTNYWGATGSKSYIGSRNGGDFFSGKVYSIRIYNRKLTEAEILANQDIDLKRFTPSTP